MVGGGGATDGGEGDGGGPADVERHSLEGELLEVECTLAGEVQQIESLAQENNKKVRKAPPPARFYVCYASKTMYGRALRSRVLLAPAKLSRLQRLRLVFGC